VGAAPFRAAKLRFGDPGQYELRIISMREQQFRSDLARGILASLTATAHGGRNRAYCHSIGEEDMMTLLPVGSFSCSRPALCIGGRRGAANLTRLKA